MSKPRKPTCHRRGAVLVTGRLGYVRLQAATSRAASFGGRSPVYATVEGQMHVSTSSPVQKAHSKVKGEVVEWEVQAERTAKKKNVEGRDFPQCSTQGYFPRR